MKLKSSLVAFYYTVINFFLFRKHHVIHSRFKINGILKISNRGTLKIGKDFNANSGVNKNPIGGDILIRLIVFKPDAHLEIGENVGISNSTIVCWEKITIGNNVIIGGSCKIWDTNFHSLDIVQRVSEIDNDVKTSPIVINDNVFIGGSVIIMKGVTIGRNSVIAAGSVVTKNIPENVIAGGNPCVVIKSLS